MPNSDLCKWNWHLGIWAKKELQWWIRMAIVPVPIIKAIFQKSHGMFIQSHCSLTDTFSASAPLIINCWYLTKCSTGRGPWRMKLHLLLACHSYRKLCLWDGALRSSKHIHRISSLLNNFNDMGGHVIISYDVCSQQYLQLPLVLYHMYINFFLLTFWLFFCPLFCS